MPDRISEPPGATLLRHVGREPHQRPREDVGDDQVERRAGGEDRVMEAGRGDRLDVGRGAVQPDIFAGDPHRHRVDVGRQHRECAPACHGDGQHGAAGAEVERVGGRSRRTTRSIISRQPAVVP